MANTNSLRKIDRKHPVSSPSKPVRADAIGETLVERLARSRTANEITSVIGLKPIRGRSGPKIAY
ncbi:hypothetical protein RGQ15_12745 [Paracoccus sp. MBLB3053]|uniref:Uncharacterized protein n=1 Tax=Paracoccus aurantius TaxID=3073814 RepID=A0ABU2HTR0_9RHOB|nr:hypothetical protein [Paracoccus sp. MBLB3053]MDS9468436.1 hypothetical protein [Paracoccus sp. MBLB3053]